MTPTRAKTTFLKPEVRTAPLRDLAVGKPFVFHRAVSDSHIYIKGSRTNENSHDHLTTGFECYNLTKQGECSYFDGTKTVLPNVEIAEIVADFVENKEPDND